MSGRLRWWMLAGAAYLVLALTLAIAMDNELESRVLAYAVKRFGQPADARLKPWFSLLHDAAALNETEKLQRVNTFFNRIPNESDASHWGAEDYWSTPVELLASNGGDCEDFALAKYFTLRELGVADARLRLTYAKAYLRQTGKIESHMVLTYSTAPGSEPLILDNLIDAIQPASRRTDLTPTYSFNVAALWVAHERQTGRNIADADVLSAWRELRSRMLRMEDLK